MATIGIDFGVKPVTVGGQLVRINFFDMAGGTEYYDIRNEFYKDAQGVIFVFDVENKQSFDNLENWVQEGEQFGLSRPAMVRPQHPSAVGAPLIVGVGGCAERGCAAALARRRFCAQTSVTRPSASSPRATRESGPRCTRCVRARPDASTPAHTSAGAEHADVLRRR